MVGTAIGEAGTCAPGTYVVKASLPVGHGAVVVQWFDPRAFVACSYFNDGRGLLGRLSESGEPLVWVDQVFLARRLFSVHRDGLEGQGLGE